MDKKGPQPVDSDLNENGRGMELSELLWFNNKLYAMDDRTGTVFELVKNGTTYKPVPWVNHEISQEIVFFKTMFWVNHN